MPQIEINGAAYHYRRLGTGPPLLLLHGFTGSSESWAGIASILASSNDVVCIDLLGHGKSERPASSGRYRIEQAARDVVTLAGKLGFEHFSLLGYSMGGRLALYVTHRYPKFIKKLILESASPGIADAEDREERRRRDRELANRIERDGIVDFVNQWERLPLFASQSAAAKSTISAQRMQRLLNDPNGLANSLRGMGTGSQPSLWGELPAITCATLLLSGELDSKYVGIARKMAGLMPHSRLEITPGSGHNVHFERPSLFTAVVASFLNQPA
ncbi:MAG: 2-succinyl-6-hydroxy-2,4-cyclohexadiene-1-carboxylate synthase [Candidatus Promineifilaceae bacterium]